MKIDTESTIERSSLSIFDIFKIGVGPSSSHTLGPWVAARTFIHDAPGFPIDSIKVHLYGSLSKTGKGHGTDVACILGLLDYDPKLIDTDLIDEKIEQVRDSKELDITGRVISFDPAVDIIFEPTALPYHPNGLRFELFYTNGEVFSETFYSVGGGFVEKERDSTAHVDFQDLPYPIETARDLIEHCEREDKNIYEIVLANEMTWNNEDSLHAKLREIFYVMKDSIYRGCHNSGILPGGLNVRRRAATMRERLLPEGVQYDDMNGFWQAISDEQHDFTSITKWVSCFALAVNEENASFGRVVTSPTNGAAGVIPAVLMYYKLFTDKSPDDELYKFFLTAGEIGCMFKKRSTISAAVGGCQAEIGVSSAMAAGGLTALLGGSAEHILCAAEIAMEHHLGLTCDPIGGLVQIPCIERNTMGAMKAITAAHLALSSEPKNAIVNFDSVVKTMWETAQDMSIKYKETSEGGLAVNLSVIQPNC